MAQSTRNTRMAIVCEEEEGCPKLPTAPEEFICLQDGFSVTPNIENIDNAELKGGLAPGKGCIGRITGESSFDVYTRNSGQVGVAPGTTGLLETLFGTVKEVATTTILAGVTDACTFEVQPGDGENYKCGDAILINGEIRPVASVDGDVITTLFNFPTAPSIGDEIAQVITLCPNDCPEKSVTLWNYMANGACIQMIPGARVTGFSLGAAAGEKITGSYTVEGTGYFYNPVLPDASNNVLDFTDDTGTYQVVVENTKSKVFAGPVRFAEAVQAAMNDSGTTRTYTVEYNATACDGTYTITSTDGLLLELLWSSGAGAANTIAELLGFDPSADSTGLNVYQSANPVDLTSPIEPTFDNLDSPLIAKGHEIYIGDKDAKCFCVSDFSFSVNVPTEDIPCIKAESGVDGKVPTERTSEMSFTAILPEYDVDIIERLVNNTCTPITYIGGVRDGACKWIPGKSVVFTIKTGAITSFSKTDLNGLVAVEVTLTGFGNNDGGEVFISYV